MKIYELRRIHAFYPALPPFFVTVLISILFFLPFGLYASPDNSGPWTTVTYIEYQRGGSESGREIPAKVQTRYGIDINSEIRIKIDADSLRAQLVPLLEDAELSKKGKMLNDRIQVLQQALSQLQLAVETTNQTFNLFQKAEQTQDYTAFRSTAKEMSRILSSMINTLFKARKQRLIYEGYSEESAEKSADAIFNSVLSNATPSLPYNWDRFEELYREEIRFAQQNLAEQLDEIGMWIEIQSHLIKKDGKSYPIPLPKYNEAKPGPFSPYPKIRFEISPQGDQLLNQFNEMAAKAGKVQNIGQALINSITMQFNSQRTELDSVFSAAQKSILKAGEKLEVLAAWTEDNRWQKWFNSVRGDLEKMKDGKNLVAACYELETICSEIKDDVLILKSYRDLKGKLAGMTPEQAMRAILFDMKDLKLREQLGVVGIRAVNGLVWKNRINKITNFMESLDKLSNEDKNKLILGDSPIGDLRDAHDALSDVADAFKQVESGLREILANIIGSQPIIAAGNLPVPPGQKKQSIIGDPGDSFDLTYLNPPPDKHDQVKVQYRFFYKEEQPINGAEWEDNFLLRVFGWQDQVLASLTFIRPEGDKSYYPTAAFSWILNKRSWPKSGEVGLGGMEGIDWFSGMGFSTMSLDFKKGQNIELGIAATVSLVNNFILAGYGANLQATENRWFGFFAIRIINNPGFMNGSK